MDIDCELNFQDTCRCCKRTESGMTSIFNEDAHSTYPAVKVMLNSITCLNVLEHDELPWLVCKLCLNSIQHAYTFIQHMNHIDGQLQLILLARRKEEDTLPQCATLKNEPEVVPVPEVKEEYNLQLQEQEQTEPLQTATKEDFNENDSLTFVDEHSDLDQELGASEKLNDPEMENVENSPGDNLLKVLYVDDMGVDEDYHEDDENDNSSDISVDSSASDSEPMEESEDVNSEAEDYQQDDEEGNNTDSSESESNSTDTNVDSSASDSNHDAADNPKLQTIGPKTTSKWTVFKCNLCVYTCYWRSLLNKHLKLHCGEKLFTCSKCNLQYARKYNMLRHKQNCNGNIIRQCTDRLKHVIPLQKLKDPLKMKKYYTVTEINMQNNDGDNIKVQRPKDGRDDIAIKQICQKSSTERRSVTAKCTVFNCKLCAYTSMVIANLKQHLYTHCKIKPFTCSKCKCTFTTKSYLRYHGRNCNGEGRYAFRKRKTSKQVISLQDLKDPVKIKKYYTTTVINM